MDVCHAVMSCGCLSGYNVMWMPVRLRCHADVLQAVMFSEFQLRESRPGLMAASIRSMYGTIIGISITGMAFTTRAYSSSISCKLRVKTHSFNSLPTRPRTTLCRTLNPPTTIFAEQKHVIKKISVMLFLSSPILHM